MKIGDKVSVIDEDLEGTLVSVKDKTAVFEDSHGFRHEYDSWERLFIQKERLMEVLDFCKANKIKRLEVIHGLGEGVLQELVYDVLRGYTGIEFEENEFFKHQSASVEVVFF